ncbi:hypothetical protein CHUAL_007913 [Chamberlinius hualienensis]
MTEDSQEAGNEGTKDEVEAIETTDNIETDKMLNEIEKMEETKVESDELREENGRENEVIQVVNGEEVVKEESGVTDGESKSTNILQRLFQRKQIKDKEIDPEANKGLLNKSAAGRSLNGEIESDSDKKKSEATAGVGSEKIDIELNNVEDENEKVRTFMGVPMERVVVLSVALFVFLIIAIVVIGILSTTSDDEFANRKYVDAFTHCGPVRGDVEDGAFVFRGIPYALPPVGSRRWKPSELAATAEDCWVETYKANNHSTLCYQKPLSKPFDKVEFSENCLFLSVYTPRISYEEPMPVVVYFAGDSFQGHDNMDYKWRPSAKLANEQEVVFVVVYYRMNAFGFLALELLTKNVETPTSGNYGLHDMLTALKWVHRNIENFGGDNAKVTVFGHGAGATGILALISSRAAQMLFTQAWITGGSSGFVNKTLREVERNNEAFNRYLMCDNAACLYNKTPEQILNAIPSSEWPFWGMPNHLKLPVVEEQVAAVPVIDGTILYDSPSSIWEGEEGDFVDAALVIGSSLDSVGSGLLDEDFENWDWEKFESVVRSHLGTFGAPVAMEAIEKYKDTNKTVVEQYVRMISDLRVTCPLLNLAYRASKVFSNSVYFYMNSYVPDSIVEYMNLSNQMAVHGLDVAAIFGRISETLANPSQRDLQFQETMQKAFYHFVKHGRISAIDNPKVPWNINWIDEELQSSKEKYSICDFWTENGFYPRFARMN